MVSVFSFSRRIVFRPKSFSKVTHFVSMKINKLIKEIKIFTQLLYVHLKKGLEICVVYAIQNMIVKIYIFYLSFGQEIGIVTDGAVLQTRAI